MRDDENRKTQIYNALASASVVTGTHMPRWHKLYQLVPGSDATLRGDGVWTLQSFSIGPRLITILKDRLAGRVIIC